MKAVYGNETVYIVMVENNLYYYGDGKNINSFGQNAVQFLRFNPHLQDISNKTIAIPDEIKKEIENHLEKKTGNDTKEGIAK